jgi:serine/threonine-protein kinase HipA
MTRLNVYLCGQAVGNLSQDDRGRLEFSYLQSALRTLSVRFPLREAPYDDAACRGFFSNLLPEGQALAAAATAHRLQTYQVFELLAVYGRECSGAATLVPDGADPEQDFAYEELTEADMAEIIRQLPNSPNFVSDRRVRMSIAGAQNKTAVAILNGKIYKPIGGAASTHIVKAAGRFKDLVQNEAFCMDLARSMGIDTAVTEIRTFEDQTCLMVRRYDRVIERNAVRRLHQEDLCQALGYPPERKYEVSNAGDKVGPGLLECLGILRATRQPVVDIAEFARRVIFNYLVGNADAHAKNFSLLYEDSSRAPVLAPAYDIVCTRLYPEFDDDFPMVIGSARQPADLDADQWRNMLGRQLGRMIRQTAIDLAKQIGPKALALQDTAPFNRRPPYWHIAACVGERAAAIGEQFGIEIDPGTPPFITKGGGWHQAS